MLITAFIRPQDPRKSLPSLVLSSLPIIQEESIKTEFKFTDCPEEEVLLPLKVLLEMSSVMSWVIIMVWDITPTVLLVQSIDLLSIWGPPGHGIVKRMFLFQTLIR